MVGVGAQSVSVQSSAQLAFYAAWESCRLMNALRLSTACVLICEILPSVTPKTAAAASS